MTDSRLKSFGFPRWGGYGKETDAQTVRMCDYTGCSERADHPAPKSPNSRERWYFCKDHAAEYNRNWNFFEGMTDDEVRTAKEDTSEHADAFAHANTYEWGGPADDFGYSTTEQKAFDVLELDVGSDQTAVKRQYRKLAKLYHPDSNPGDPDARERFHSVQAAYDLLKQ